jgi:hypothetical protein
MFSGRGRSPPPIYEGVDELALVKTNKPPWVLDATAQAPGSQDDFVGWYQSVYISDLRFEVRKEEGEFVLGEFALEPNPDALGFLGQLGDGTRLGFRYNKELSQFEWYSPTRDLPGRLPVARIEAPSPEGSDEAMPGTWIGVPFIKD